MRISNIRRLTASCLGFNEKLRFAATKGIQELDTDKCLTINDKFQIGSWRER